LRLSEGLTTKMSGAVVYRSRWIVLLGK